MVFRKRKVRGEIVHFIWNDILRSGNYGVVQEELFVSGHREPTLRDGDGALFGDIRDGVSPWREKL